MGSNKKILILFILLIIMPLAYAQNFEIFTDSVPDELCPGTTGLFTDVIKNLGTEAIPITISSTGTSSSFSTTVPNGFTLLPNQIKTIYTYVSPKLSTNVGTYSLNIKASSNGKTSEITHSLLVNDCYDYSLESLTPQRNICPSDTQTFEFQLTNNGKYTESYALTLEGEYANSMVLSIDKVTLNSGETSKIFAYATSSSSDVGNYDFTIKATPLNSKSVRTATSTLTVDPCYDFGISAEKNLVNMCEHTQETIPITIKNTGSITNRFDLNTDGPVWANLDKNSINIAPNSEQTINLILNPDYGIEGNFEIALTSIPDKGTTKAQNTFNVNVKKCHGVSVDIEKSSDSICNSLENTYNINVRNIGEFSNDYYLKIDGPDWASLDKTTTTLGVGEEDQFTLTIDPPFNTPKATYIINVQATAKDSTKIVSSDKIEITTITQDECYQASLNVEDTSIEVPYDSSTTVPIIIENKGTYQTTYDVSISGTASNFAYLNPSSITLDVGKSEVIYLYLSPSGEVNNGDYSLTTSIKTGDSPILASDKINIKVSESQFTTPEDSTYKPSILSRIIGFFTNIFKPEITTPEEQPSENETNSITQESQEIIEETPIIEESPATTVEELTSENITFTEGQSESFLLNGEEHKIELTSIETNSILLTISSDPISISMNEGDINKIDLDNDGIYDLQVTFNGYDSEGNADISYEKISEPIPVEEEVTEETPTTEEEITVQTTPAENEAQGKSFFGGFLSSFSTIFASIASLKYRIIGLIILIIILYLIFKTKFYKKIADFFEEEIEEEEIPILGKKEEPKKKETKKKEEVKKKETKKPAKKETTKKKETKKKEVTEDTEDEIEIKGLDENPEDKEDFIIEFDDEK